MINTLITNLITNPLYNFFIALQNISWVDAGIAAIIITIIVKIMLFPLARKVIRSQILMKKIQPEMDAVKEKFKDVKTPEERSAMGMEMMNIYKKHQVNPFGSIVLIFVQLPIFFALYYIFAKTGLPEVDTQRLYSFVSEPDSIKMTLIGFYDLSKTGVWSLALLAGIAQFVQVKLSMGQAPEKKENPTMQDDLARNMHNTMKYFMPIIIVIISLNLPAVMSVYFIFSSLFIVGQEMMMKKEKEELRSI
jgi:YidC/Oxa1 family membrane protein insertase